MDVAPLSFPVNPRLARSLDKSNLEVSEPSLLRYIFTPPLSVSDSEFLHSNRIPEVVEYAPVIPNGLTYPSTTNESLGIGVYGLAA